MKKLIIASILMLFSFVAISNEELPTLYQGAVPTLCGDSEEIKKVAEDRKMFIFSTSLGRAGADQNGDIAYVVTHWVESQGSSQMFTITTVDGKESCILMISFDTLVNPNLGSGI